MGVGRVLRSTWICPETVLPLVRPDGPEPKVMPGSVVKFRRTVCETAYGVRSRIATAIKTRQTRGCNVGFMPTCIASVRQVTTQAGPMMSTAKAELKAPHGVGSRALRRRRHNIGGCFAKNSMWLHSAQIKVCNCKMGIAPIVNLWWPQQPHTNGLSCTPCCCGPIAFFAAYTARFSAKIFYS